MALRGVRAIMATLALAVASTAFGVFTASTAAVAAPCTGTAAAEISSLTFNPPTVAPGQSSTATVVAQNCTNATLSVSGLWLGRFLGSGTGIPPGCLVFDPLVLPMTLPPLGQASSSLGFLTFAPCTATSLRVTVTLSSGGTTLSQRSADLAITAATSTCTVAYRTQSEWSGGFVANVTITNTGTVPIVNWVLAFSFPGDQRITNAWNVLISQSGSAVTARNVSYNATISPGGTVSFGFQGSWQASDAPPTTFTLNARPCTTG